LPALPHPERAARLAKQAVPTAPAHVCIDFRFQEHLRRYWLYATLSVWTQKPGSATLALDLPLHETGEGSWGLCDVRNWYTGLRDGFEKHVYEHFRPAEMKILDREHRSPQFWIVPNAGIPAVLETADHLTASFLMTSRRALACC
jgi:hypothetical protein